MAFLDIYKKQATRVAPQKKDATLPTAYGKPTRNQMLLVAMYAYGRSCTTQEMTVFAWRMFPDIYGLTGFTESFPDHSLVKVKLYESLLPRKWVEKDSGVFRLTRAGRELAERLLDTSEILRNVHGGWSRKEKPSMSVGNV